MKIWRAIGLGLIASLSSGSLTYAQDASSAPVAAGLPPDAHAGPNARPSSAESAATPVLPPVVVPLPPEEDVPPEAPTRREPTGALTVVPVDAQRAQARVAADVIASAPGIVLQDRGGLLQSKTLSIRGASSNGVLVLLDGVPLNGAGGSVDLSRVPLALVDRFEVLRGSGASYGSGALGGVVNVVTRQPSEGAVVGGGITLGSFGTAVGNLSASGALLGGTGLVIVHGERSDGAFPYEYDSTPLTRDDPVEHRIRQNNDVALGGALVRYRRALSESTHLDATAELSADGRGLAGTAAAPTPEVRMNAQRALAQVRLVRRLEHGGEISARAFGSRERIDLQHFFDQQPQTLSTAGVTLDGRWLVADRHGLSASVQLGYDGLVVDGGEAPSWFKGSAAVSDEILFLESALSLVPSVRVDRAGPFTTVSPKLGASAVWPRGFTVRANLGQSHRAPSFLELYVTQGTLLPNADLRPERALSADLGVTHETSITTVAVTGFYSLYQDLIAYEYYPPFLARPYNFNTARVDGIEAEASVHPSDHVAMSASYTLTHSQNLRDDPRFYLRELPYRPRHRVFARASGGVRWARLHAELDFQSAQFINRAGTRTLPARAFVNLGATSEVWRKPDVLVSLDVKNVLDIQSQDFDGYPLPGRAVYLTLSFSLDAGAKDSSRGDLES